MKKVVPIILSLCLFPAYGQTPPTNESQYDFWVGKWEVTWQENNGGTGRGTNEIYKILDGTALEENFIVLEGTNIGYKGRSISSYNEKNNAWKQVWVDNNGGYIELTGDIDGEDRIFKTKPVEQDGVTATYKMVFYDIKEDSFVWDWKKSTDGGQTWELSWRIHYRRAM